MNLKQVKRLRRALRIQLALKGVVGDRPERDNNTWDLSLRPTKRGTTITVDKGKETEKVYDDAAIRVTLHPTSPRAIYKRIKQRVQANRKAG